MRLVPGLAVSVRRPDEPSSSNTRPKSKQKPDADEADRNVKINVNDVIV